MMVSYEKYIELEGTNVVESETACGLLAKESEESYTIILMDDFRFSGVSIFSKKAFKPVIESERFLFFKRIISEKKPEIPATALVAFALNSIEEACQTALRENMAISFEFLPDAEFVVGRIASSTESGIMVDKITVEGEVFESKNLILYEEIANLNLLSSYETAIVECGFSDYE